MFYSQFILAKKGPLGTIWIAAHLERKLRKNQVADTDIGVSVDSILFPDVPIALRLSSHLLLGVVRIYSRKVNYLFDDCSEALLKVKQAFRSTAVDLPPEESTAPYHSITLPETFDLDDFELPDSENFHGNYDHHVSAREQITLQDSMEGVVFSTSQFGLDERFGDEDTSGLDLDEELFLSKATAPGPAEDMRVSDADHESTQPLTPFDLSKDVEDAHDDMEAADHGGDDDPMDYAHAPSTPGLVEEPNFSKVQGAVCDDHLDLADDPNLVNVQDAPARIDHMELEDLNLCAVEENMGNIAQNSDLHPEMQNAVNPPLPTETDSVSVFGDQNIALKAGEIISSDAGNELRSAEEGVFSNNGPATFSVGEANADRGDTQEVGLDDTVVCPPSSHETHVSEDPFGNISVTEDISKKSGFEHVPEGLSDGCQNAQGPEVSNNVEDARGEELLPSVSSVLASDIEVSGSGVVEFEDPETHSYKQPNDSSTLNTIVPKELAVGDMHILRRCNDLDQPSSVNNGCDVFGSHEFPFGASGPCGMDTPFGASGPFGMDTPFGASGPCGMETPFGASGPCGMDTSKIKEVSDAPEASTVVQGEGYPATDFVAPVMEEYQTTEPTAQEDIRVDSMLSRDTLSKNIHSYETYELPAVEKLLSVPEGLAHPQNNFLEFTPANTQLGTGYGGDAGIGITSGRKRSFAESSLTVQSIDSVDSFEALRSKRAKESVPDDNDLLSSILVGRKSSVLIVKATPPVQQTVRAKRPRSAPRPSASKRKVIMDDTMVLHGDVIRQQLTNTEDIRRVRKKAPCTRSEIWMIQKQMLEDEIFSEPIITGLSAGLALLHTQSYDLSRIRLSQENTQDSVINAAPENENDPRKATNDFELSAEPNFDKYIPTEGFFESYVVGNDLVAECPDNQESVDRILESTGHGCTQPQVMATTDVLQPQSLSHENPALVAEIDPENQSTELNPPTGPVLESALPSDALSGDKSVVSASSIDPPALADQETNVDSSLHIEASGLPFDQNLNSLFVETVIAGDYISSEHKDSDAVKLTEENEDSSAFGATMSTGREEPPLKEGEDGVSFGFGEDMQTVGREEPPLKEGEDRVSFGFGEDMQTVGREEPPLKEGEDGVSFGFGEDMQTIGKEEPPLKDVEDGVSFGFGEDMQTVCNPHITDTHPPIAACAEYDRPVDHVDITLDGSLQDMFNDELPTKEVDFPATGLDYASKVPTSYGSTEEPNFSVVHPEELGGYSEHASINGGDYPSALEADPQSTIDAENLASGHADIEDSELGYGMDGHDTGFLNDDDDDIAEEDEFYVPSPDRTTDDYSGWSSRTRAVAKYLHVLFDKEPDNEKKSLPMDNLLVGKTRKEASRMFFEALVLKTRDYVHVEQANPFDKINIKPGVKMAKSDF